jgi:hypothetical protein
MEGEGGGGRLQATMLGCLPCVEGRYTSLGSRLVGGAGDGPLEELDDNEDLTLTDGDTAHTR